MAHKNGKDGRMAHEGGWAGMHHEGSLYGTHEGDRREGSFAPDMRVERGLGKRALRDEEDLMRDADADAFFRRHGINPDKL